jgi:hypothetical protein
MAEYDAYDYQNVPDSNYDAYDYQYVPSTSGDQEFMNFMTEAYKNDPANSASFADIASKAVSALGEGAGDFLKKYLYNPTTGKVNLAGLGTAGMALYKMMNKGESGGYNKPVPNLTASRQQIQYNDPNRVAGSAGRQYFTDTKYDGTDPAVQMYCLFQRRKDLIWVELHN